MCVGVWPKRGRGSGGVRSQMQPVELAEPVHSVRRLNKRHGRQRECRGGKNGGLKVAKYGKRPSLFSSPTECIVTPPCMQSYDVEGRGGGVPKLVGKRVYQG